MIEATISVLFRCSWISRLQNLSSANIKLTQCCPKLTRRGVLALARITGLEYDPTDLAKQVSSLPDVVDANFTKTGRKEYLGIVETTSCRCASTLLPYYNLVEASHEGDSMKWTLLFKDPKDMKRLLRNLEESGVEHRVEKTTKLRRHFLLTDRQEQILQAALSLGFYNIPKGIGLRELSDIFKVSPRAVSETLRRAEGKVIAKYLVQSRS